MLHVVWRTCVLASTHEILAKYEKLPKIEFAFDCKRAEVKVASKEWFVICSLNYLTTKFRDFVETKDEETAKSEFDGSTKAIKSSPFKYLPNTQWQIKWNFAKLHDSSRFVTKVKNKKLLHPYDTSFDENFYWIKSPSVGHRSRIPIH